MASESFSDTSGRYGSRSASLNLQKAQGAPMASFACIFVALCLVFSLVPLSTFISPPAAGPTFTSPVIVPQNETYLLPRFQVDLHLDQNQCRAEFSRFYPQLIENERIWKSKLHGGITYTDVQNAALSCRHGCAHVLLQHGQIFIKSQAKDWQSRVRSILHLLRTAYDGASVEEKQHMERTELVISTSDFDGFEDAVGSRGAGWVLDKRVGDTEGQYLFPDFSFASWPEAGIASYAEFRREAERVNQQYPWAQKSNKAFWRGDLLAGSNIAARASLLKEATGPGTEGWSDVQRTSFWEPGPHMNAIVAPHDHCKHKFLLHAEGVAYSGRSKFVLGCQSAVIMHPLQWTQHFHPALIDDPASPDRNILVLPGPYFEALPNTMQQLVAEEQAPHNSPTTGERIAANAKRTLTDRYLTPAATACYLRAALLSYASLLRRDTWPAGAPALVSGAGVKPGAGALASSLKDLGVQGDIELSVWENLGQPEWPPQ